MRISLPMLTAAFALVALPALAGPAETAFLAKLPGTWTGSGAITGGESGSVACTLTLTGSDKINFRGTCDAGQFGPQTYSGVLTYVDAARQYQARSNGQTVVGVKSGGGVVFTSKMKTVAGTGNSIMRLSASSIVIDVDIVRSDTGEKLKSHIVFKK
ncbi:MAG TPA: hypothetical protein VN109_09160 [Devosia sp.]|jgi:hypothetical protein|nr:hypothetical protein [Devosia sp.]